MKHHHYWIGAGPPLSFSDIPQGFKTNVGQWGERKKWWDVGRTRTWEETPDAAKNKTRVRLTTCPERERDCSDNKAEVWCFLRR